MAHRCPAPAAAESLAREPIVRVPLGEEDAASSGRHVSSLLSFPVAGAGLQESYMSKLLRGLAAGRGAKKLGGGCFSTVLVFLLLWWLLGSVGIFK
jgi:hypothetical protein